MTPSDDSTVTTPGSGSDVEEALDRLYSVPPEQFTGERDALAKALRTHDREAAARVRSLRRPTVTAWALNRLARDAPGELVALFDADASLARSQREGAGREALAEAGRARREIIRRLVDSAASILTAAGHPDSPGGRDRLAQSLSAVAVDEEGRETLARGRLTRDLTPSSFWESTPAEVDPAVERREELARRAGEVAAEARRLDDDASMLEAEADRAERAARAARAAAIEARRKAARAGEEAEEAAGEADR